MKKTFLWLIIRLNYLYHSILLKMALLGNSHHLTMQSNSDSAIDFNGLCDLYGSDKGSNIGSSASYPWMHHSYGSYYEKTFADCRFRIRAVFECGIGTASPGFMARMGDNYVPGASLRVWRDFFPNAHVFGADIDTEVMFTEERITTFHVDQTDEDSIRRMWQKLPGVKFDLMIDDGLHEYHAGISLFEASIGRLLEHGKWVIEDVTPSDARKYLSYFSKSEWNIKIVDFRRPGVRAGDNRLVVVNRKT